MQRLAEGGRWVPALNLGVGCPLPPLPGNQACKCFSRSSEVVSHCTIFSVSTGGLSQARFQLSELYILPLLSAPDQQVSELYVLMLLLQSPQGGSTGRRDET